MAISIIRAQTLINPSLMLLLIFTIFCTIGSALALSFEYDTFTQSPSDITFVQQDDWYTGQMPQWNAIAISLTPDPERLATKDASNLGKVVYKDPITLTLNQSYVNSSATAGQLTQEASFKTSFTFQIKNMGTYPHCGSGMAFFMSSEIKAPNNSDKYGGLGLVDGTKNATDPPDAPFFAIEFDTFISKTYHDVSASHVGIDVSSLVSLNVTDTSNSTSPLYLYRNYTFAVWIEYDAAAHFIQVWMTNVSAGSGAARIATLRPPQPCVTLQYDLSSVFRTPVYAGFSGANYIVSTSPCAQGIAIFSWSFSTDTLNIKSADHTKPHQSINLIVIMAPCISFIVLLIVAGFIIIKLRSKRLDSESRNVSIIQNISANSGSLLRYRLNQLIKSTHSFSEKCKLGEGGFSTVFKGTLPSGKIVAIKKFKESVKKEDQFASEIQIINSIRHRNLLQLEGWCYEKGQAMLIYRYISNGSLDQYLFGKKRDEVTLDFNTRLKILKGVASALEYLHSGLGDCILHRDVKAANVLLTEDFEPILGDFGLARLISHDHPQTLTAAGTPGYVAPELIYTGKATDKADVYSFGVLALELATGHRVCDGPPRSQEVSSLFDWVWTLRRRDMLLEALDIRARHQGTLTEKEEQQWMCVLHLGILCSHPSPECRPSMRQVTQALQESTILPLPLARPIFPNISYDESSIETIPLIYEKDSSISTFCDPTSSSFTISSSEMYKNI